MVTIRNTNVLLITGLTDFRISNHRARNVPSPLFTALGRFVLIFRIILVAQVVVVGASLPCYPIYYRTITRR